LRDAVGPGYGVGVTDKVLLQAMRS
jgi:hypothetical protein